MRTIAANEPYWQSYRPRTVMPTPGGVLTNYALVATNRRSRRGQDTVYLAHVHGSHDLTAVMSMVARRAWTTDGKPFTVAGIETMIRFAAGTDDVHRTARETLGGTRATIMLAARVASLAETKLVFRILVEDRSPEPHPDLLAVRRETMAATMVKERVFRHCYEALEMHLRGAEALTRDHSAPTLEAIANKATNAVTAKRLRALAALYRGESQGDVARANGIGTPQIGLWIAMLNEGGPDRLTAKPKRAGAGASL